MKIEMIVPSLPAAGMEMVVARLTRGLTSRGHDVGVTCTERKGAIGESLETEGYRVTVVPTPGLRTIIFPRHLCRSLEQRRPEVIHIHTGAWLKAARAGKMAHVPRIIFTMHGLDGTRPLYEPLLDRWAARHTTLTVAVSNAFLPYLGEKLRIPADRLRVIPNGVDLRHFQPALRTGTVRARFGLGNADVVIGHVARFSPVKNHAVLIAAFAEVLHEHPHAFLALIGDGPLRPHIESRVDALGIRSRVGFLGQLEDVAEVYPDLDMLVLPSLTEATSMSILEGMATALPVVATGVGGTPALLADGEVGLLVPSDNAPALAAAISRLVRAPAERVRLGQAARHRVEYCYSEERMLDEYEALYAPPSPPNH